MVQYGKYIYCTCWSYQNSVIKIDTETDRVVDRLTVGIQPSSIAIDRNDKLWVLTDGGYDGSPYGYEAPTICRIDAETFAIEKRYTMRLGESPSELQLNGDRDKLLWINGGIWCMEINADALPCSASHRRAKHDILRSDRESRQRRYMWPMRLITSREASYTATPPPALLLTSSTQA